MPLTAAAEAARLSVAPMMDWSDAGKIILNLAVEGHR
jgi:hypothetical protein